METTTGNATMLVGKSFDCVFGTFVPRLTVLTPTELHVQATIGETEIDEVVKSDLTNVRQNLFIMSWTERNGTFVVQVQDHDSKVVHNYARLADGQMFVAQGMIKPVQPM